MIVPCTFPFKVPCLASAQIETDFDATQHEALIDDDDIHSHAKHGNATKVMALDYLNSLHEKFKSCGPEEACHLLCRARLLAPTRVPRGGTA
jgi:hypothetical protein